MNFTKEQAESILRSLTSIQGQSVQIKDARTCYDGYSLLAKKMVPDNYFWLFMQCPENGDEATLISTEVEELSATADEYRIICCVAVRNQCFLIAYEGISVPQYAYN